MKKLYYTCPIEAAYMRKNFGIKLTVAAYDKWGQNYHMVECFPDIDKPSTYYIHSDSLAIFKPQPKDQLEYYSKSLGMLLAYYFSESGIKWKDVTGMLQELPDDAVFVRITQRNGASFLMPKEVEDA